MLFLYIFLPLIGICPLIMVIRNMIKAYNIKSHGIKTDATVVKIDIWGTSIRNRVDRLTLHYKVESEKSIYPGAATATPGKYKIGDILQISYLPTDPYQMTVKGANVHVPILIFTILLFLFILFATFKIGELV